MTKSTNRRSFIQKMAAATSGIILATKTSFGQNPSNIMQPIIKSIRPLGFQWETQDPFLFCVHHEDFFPKGNDRMGPDPKEFQGREMGQDFMIKDGYRMYHGKTVPGFPGHPHRGFETITIVRKGIVDHSDSLGASGRYGNGDVQWMTAGEGVQHAEMFPLINREEENPMELFQIWLNLPKRNKMVNPHFKMLWSDTIPNHEHFDSNGKKTVAQVIAGKIEQDKAPTPPPDSWSSDSENEVAVWNIEMEAGASWTLPKTRVGVNRTLYLFKGQELSIEGQTIKNYHAAELRTDVGVKLLNGPQKAHFLILQGKPINEPVVQHGPFVMNSKDEIRQAFMDYQRTQFGGWPWPVNDPVHPRSKGRFAKHSDGKLEEK